MTVAPPPVTPLDVVRGGELLLSLLKEQLQAQECELPSRVGMVPGGQLAFDGDQLTVMLANITAGMPGRPTSGQPVHPAQLVQYYAYEVNLLRNVSTVDEGGNAPDPATLTTEYEMIATDAAQLWAAIVAIHNAGALVPRPVPMTMGPLITLGPEGGLAGVRLPVSWQATAPNVIPQPGP